MSAREADLPNRRSRFGDPAVETSPRIGDEVKTTTCYMCACRCGIRVHVRDGRLRYIEGNRAHPVNRGVICAKGSAGIMQQHSPAKLTQPLLRIGERGEGKFKPITWDEALATATRWLSRIRANDPRKFAFFTGRDQSQMLTGWWAAQFGTPNYAAHGGFCSVNMAAAGLYTIGGAFWEFGTPDWERTKYLMLFGVAEDHDSNPIKIGLGKLKGRGAKVVSVNPVRTGYSAIADEWIGIRPGSDGLFVMALIHELLRTRRVDLEFLVRYTNAPWLVIEAPGQPDDGLFARDDAGEPLCWDRVADQPRSALAADVSPALQGAFTLADGRRARPVFDLILARYGDAAYAPERAAERTDVSAETIRRITAELAHVAFDQAITLEVPWTDWAGRRHDRVVGRPVAMHAMRGISAHANGFQTCRAIHLLQMLLGTIDVPGGFRYKPPFPRPIPPAPRPAGHAADVAPDRPMAGPPLGFPRSPADLLVEPDGTPRRIDKAYSWEAPLAAHGLMHMVVRNAWAGDPYPIDTLLLFMSNMSWNSAMNTTETMRMLTDKDAATGEYRIPRIIYADAYASEMVGYADLVLPDTTYLERHDCISLLDRPISEADAPGDAIRQPVLTPDRDVRPFQDVLIDLGARLGLPGLVKDDGTPRYPGGFPDYMVHHERLPGVGPLAGWRGAQGEDHGRGAPNPDQLARYKEHGCFWHRPLPEDQRFYRHANRRYLDWAAEAGFIPPVRQIVLQLYSEEMQSFRLAAQGHGPVQPPDHRRAGVVEAFDPLPHWQPAPRGHGDKAEFPLYAITQRPMPMYHAWGSHNAWLRQILGENRLYLSRALGHELGIEDDDWVWVESPTGRLRVQARLMDGVHPRTVWTWNAVGKRSGAWNLDADAPESRRGFLLNHLIPDVLGDRSNSDPITGQAAWYDLRVRVSKAPAPADDHAEPRFATVPPAPGLPTRPAILRYGASFRGPER
ncbi:MAG: molybdopterin oxidoreductase family protein [Alphaproteobacteria bacterium]